ncbi:hypothetical protein U9M48_010233 [Paspalum notatum var. saurae]|uniref:Protein yippee-like n=1 Tax=Paspalum notatum var. saurae TaxID=547442 RepID=A0AAQ3ST26_PASNO
MVSDGEGMGNAAAAAVAELTCRLTLDADDGNDFHCRTGRAYLFDKVTNVTVGEKEERMMITGLHLVSDVFCGGCQETVGWKYEVAYERSQKYKEGKFILERQQLLGPE